MTHNTSANSTFNTYTSRPSSMKGVIEAASCTQVERPLSGPWRMIVSPSGKAKLLFFPGLAKELATPMLEAMRKLPFTPAKAQINVGAWKKNRFPRPQQVAWCYHNKSLWAAWREQTRPLCDLLGRTNSVYFPDVHKQQTELCTRAEAVGLQLCPPFTTVTLNSGRAAYGKPHHHRENAKGVMQWLAYCGKFDGGELVLPGFGLNVPVQHGDVVAFLGEEIVHGVAPFTGERFCAVYWVCGGLWKCFMN
jgi:hypothetical protein